MLSAAPGCYASPMAEMQLPAHVASRRRDGRHEVLLHRSMAVIGPERIEIKSARSTVILPLIGLGLAALAGAIIIQQQGDLPFWFLAGTLFLSLLVVPLSVMSLVSSFIGADVVIDVRKNSATWQQGYLGMGIGTNELVPFEKIDYLEVTIEGDQPDRWHEHTDTFRQFALWLVKVSGRRLRIANVPVPERAQTDGMDRVLTVANAVAAVTGKEVRLPEGWELVEIDTDTGEIVGKPGGKRRKRAKGGPPAKEGTE